MEMYFLLHEKDIDSELFLSLVSHTYAHYDLYRQHSFAILLILLGTISVLVFLSEPVSRGLLAFNGSVRRCDNSL